MTNKIDVLQLDKNKLRNKLLNLKAEYEYSIINLGRDLVHISDTDYRARCVLEKVVDDLDEILREVK